MGFLVFGAEAENYKSFPSSARTLLLKMFGNVDYVDVSPGHVVICRLYFLSFVIAVVIVLSNMFVTILDDQLATSKRNPGGPGGDSDMGDFMVNRFLQFLGINTATRPPKGNENSRDEEMAKQLQDLEDKLDLMLKKINDI
ncbi:polycystin-2-like protein 1 [Branchiostoma floridae x Branchiostoma japonicum]